MARIVKIAWPAVGKPYRGFITKFRQCLDEVYDAVLHSPKEKGTIRAQFEAFATAAGIAATPLPATQALVGNGASLPVKNSAGNETKTGTATVAANAITGIALAATVALVDNADTITVTGTGTTCTLTVANGVVTGGVLS